MLLELGYAAREVDALARKGAEVYHKVAEEARQAFNENGGNIGKLIVKV